MALKDRLRSATIQSSPRREMSRAPLRRSHSLFETVPRPPAGHQIDRTEQTWVAPHAAWNTLIQKKDLRASKPCYARILAASAIEIGQSEMAAGQLTSDTFESRCAVSLIRNANKQSVLVEGFFRHNGVISRVRHIAPTIPQ